MLIKLKNDKFTVEINSFGAEINSFCLNKDNSDLIWRGSPSVWKNHAPILFPFVARCLDGYYLIDGKKYEFSRNHGFARDMETKVIFHDETKAIFELTENDDTLKKFPYKFSLCSEYELTEKGLNWKLIVKNTDSLDFKFSIGTHTAFTCPQKNKSQNINDYYLEFQNHEELTSVLCTEDGYLQCDEKGNVPVTKKYGESKKGIIPLTNEGFGNGHLFTNFTSEWVGLRNKNDNSLIKISTKGFPYCMIWQNTTQQKEFVCIEPWHGIPDKINTNHEWNNKEGFILLQSGKSFTCEQNIFIE